MRSALLTTMLLAMIASSGCRTATRTIDESRVDVDMPHEGNRGYLVGTPPAWEGPKQTIRKMVEMEIETPPIWKPAQQETPSAAPAEERPPYTK